MKYVSEYRQPTAVKRVLAEIEKTITRSWVLMEVCGGQTHSFLRYGLDKLLPPTIELVHGPGCPVCVTPSAIIDQALALAARPGIIFASYGDMLRVPGTLHVAADSSLATDDLLGVKSRGGDVRIVYSPLDAVAIARQEPHKTVVFLAIGFETTAPANALAVQQAAREELANFCVLVSHVTVPPAIAAIMAGPGCRVNGFLAAGHVCTIMGIREYEPLARRYRVPIVVTGFEPLDLALGVLTAVRQLENGQFTVENVYTRTAPSDGNRVAQAIIADVFAVCDRTWRGIGLIPRSGYRLRPAYRAFDAEQRFPNLAVAPADAPAICQSGLVLQGLLKPDQCPAFGKLCTPRTPLGATMVSSEGACAAYYRYGRVTV